jgi:tRNA(fMet)-specific endonuclease VapC
VSRLFDTNAYTALKRGHPEVTRLFKEAPSLVFSTIVIGELTYGFRHGTQFARNSAALDDMLGAPRVRVLPVSRLTADRYSRISAELRRTGKMIPTNDIWIAAHTFESGAELLSFDAHFAAVPGLVWTHLR